MRIYILLLAVSCSLCCCVLPAKAVESPEALAVRINEIEKANFVLQEDLTRSRIELNMVISILKKAQITDKDSLQKLIDMTNKEATDSVAALQKQLKDEIAARDELQQNLASNTTAQGSELAKQKDMLSKLQTSIDGTSKALNERLKDMQDLIDKVMAIPNAELADRIKQMQKELDELKLQGGMAILPTFSALDPSKLATQEIYRLRIVNRKRGEVFASRNGGKTWTPIGHVLAPAFSNGYQEHLTPSWALTGAVATTADDAITIRTGYNEPAQRGQIFSILPCPADVRHADRNRDTSAIITDIPSGTGLFGDDWGPIPGNPVMMETPVGLRRLLAGYTPQEGDIYQIPVLQPATSPQAFIFDNFAGGFVTAVSWEGKEKVVGDVLRPVIGIGRYNDNIFAPSGRLSANTNGALDISVAPAGTVAKAGMTVSEGKSGGFRIQLCERGMNAETLQVRTQPQVMLVEETNAQDPSWDGLAPLFLGYLHPRWSNRDWNSPDWVRLLTARVRVDVQLNNGPWQAMPEFTLDNNPAAPLPDWSKTALQHITRIRINLPVEPAPAAQ